MRLWTFLRFMRTVRSRREIDLERIKGMGLLAVKVGQILALRPDLLPPERCLELQGLYQRTHTKHAAPLSRLMEANCPPGFAEHFASIDEEPMAAASIGQVHAATLLDGREVVIKFVKDDFEGPFKKDVARMKRWLSAVLFFSPRLRKVGNPMALLNHIETYTLDELDLRNERRGQIRLLEAIESVKDEFPLERLRFPEIHTDISSERVLVVERVREPSIEDRIDDGSLGWEDLLQLFRIQGAFMFGLGTFHGDLHPGNAMLSEDGTYTFIDTGAICEAPEHVRAALFGFFEHLARGNLDAAFMAMLGMAATPPTGAKLERYMRDMHELYDGFVGTSVSEVSLTQQMMKTVRTSVLAGCTFGEEAFPIIRSLMYMDGMVLRSHPDVDLITSMGPHLDAFKAIMPEASVDVPSTKQRSHLAGTPVAG